MSEAPQRPEKTVSEIRNVAVSFSGKLDSGEKLAGTPTVVEVTTSDLTLGNKVVNTAELIINGIIVPIGEAVQWNVSGGTVQPGYITLVSVGTDATPAQTLYGSVILDVIADSAT